MTKLESIPENLRVAGLRFPDEEDKTLFIPDRNMVALEKLYLSKWEREAKLESA